MKDDPDMLSTRTDTQRIAFQDLCMYNQMTLTNMNSSTVNICG